MSPPRIHQTAQEFLLQQVLDALREIGKNVDELGKQVRALENDANKAERIRELEKEIVRIKTYGSIVFLIPIALGVYNLFK